jgi:hypothetical protein
MNKVISNMSRLNVIKVSNRGGYESLYISGLNIAVHMRWFRGKTLCLSAHTVNLRGGGGDCEQHPWQKSPFFFIKFQKIFCQIASGFHFFGFRDSVSPPPPTARSSSWLPTANLEGQAPVFMSASNRSPSYCPGKRAPLFVAFLDFQRYGGGEEIVTPLHTGRVLVFLGKILFQLRALTVVCKGDSVFFLWGMN